MEGTSLLQIKNITKTYGEGAATQQVLKRISLDFRDSEFVSILGASGSGKTTLLNIIGGLVVCDSGDLIINGVSTANYKDRDWDDYRNHKIGFVFQSYHLIPHQTVIENVELALTIAGMSPAERKRKAEKALIRVGLGDHINKKPNQLSGGQMQRVAIARAIVNQPDILLADEPTGALDSVTSVQIMDILKEISRDRLVIMVTHNPELAEEYSSRIIRLGDGQMINDTNPFHLAEEQQSERKIETAGDIQKGRKEGKSKKGRRSAGKSRGKKAGMSFLTALSLSFRNLLNKKGRTILTAFAGSIGIIGIALVLSVSSGINAYIDEMQESTLKEYPITISETGTSSAYGGGQSQNGNKAKLGSDRVYADTARLKNTIDRTTVTNDLKAFRKYLKKKDNAITKSASNIVFSYSPEYSIWSRDRDGELVSSGADTSQLTADPESGATMQTRTGGGSFLNLLNGVRSTDTNFSELTPGTDGELISSDVTKNYDILYGRWPQSREEVVLVVNRNNAVRAESLYQLGLITGEQLQEMAADLRADREVTQYAGHFEEICQHIFHIIPGDGEYSEDTALTLTISGIVRLSEDAENQNITTVAAYTTALTDWLVDQTGISRNKPSSIRIYTDSFESRQQVVDGIDKYNKKAKEEKKISYTDYAGMMTSTATSMVDIITWILVALMAVSLIVSSIMIAIITHISVIERTKEIGILRSLGASKRNVSNVFNAETLLIGFCAGVIGVVVVMILSIPITSLAVHMLEIEELKIFLPIRYAFVLILLSMVITVVSGLLPSKRASAKDPAASLRTE